MSLQPKGKEKSGHQDPQFESKTTGPSRTPRDTRAHSLSPRKRHPKQPLHIRLNLTENQMDKITDAFAQKVNCTTPERQYVVNSSHSMSNRGRDNNSSYLTGEQQQRVHYQHVHQQQHHQMHPLHAQQHQHHLHAQQATLGYGANERDDRHNSASTTFSEPMPTPQFPTQYAAWQPSLAARRNRDAPSPLKVDKIKKPAPATVTAATTTAAPVPRRTNMESVHEAVSPLGSSVGVGDDGGGGGFNDHHQQQPEISPSIYSPYFGGDLDSPRKNRPWIVGDQVKAAYLVNDEELDAYNGWGEPGTPFGFPSLGGPSSQVKQQYADAHEATQGIAHIAARLGAAAEIHTGSPAPLSHDGSAGSGQESAESDQFSPLAIYFRTHGLPQQRKGGKTLIGQNGWLERIGPDPAAAAAAAEKPSTQKKHGILDSIKKLAKDITPNRRGAAAHKENTGPSMPVSLNPREQSLLYCELEFHLTTSINTFICFELDRGRLDHGKHKKIADAWSSLGRPKVVGFRYDLETQIDLVMLHVDDFSFHGRRQGNPAEIAGLLHTMKANARAMRIRTFCQPDKVIAKHIVDALALFQLINAGEAQTKFSREATFFFNAVIARVIRAFQHREASSAVYLGETARGVYKGEK